MGSWTRTDDHTLAGLAWVFLWVYAFLTGMLYALRFMRAGRRAAAVVHGDILHAVGPVTGFFHDLLQVATDAWRYRRVRGPLRPPVDPPTDQDSWQYKSHVAAKVWFLSQIPLVQAYQTRRNLAQTEHNSRERQRWFRNVDAWCRQNWFAFTSRCNRVLAASWLFAATCEFALKRFLGFLPLFRHRYFRGQRQPVSPSPDPAEPHTLVIQDEPGYTVEDVLIDSDDDDPSRGSTSPKLAGSHGEISEDGWVQYVLSLAAGICLVICSFFFVTINSCDDLVFLALRWAMLICPPLKVILDVTDILWWLKQADGIYIYVVLFFTTLLAWPRFAPRVRRVRVAQAMNGVDREAARDPLDDVIFAVESLLYLPNRLLSEAWVLCVQSPVLTAVVAFLIWFGYSAHLDAVRAQAFCHNLHYLWRFLAFLNGSNGSETRDGWHRRKNDERKREQKEAATTKHKATPGNGHKGQPKPASTEGVSEETQTVMQAEAPVLVTRTLYVVLPWYIILAQFIFMLVEAIAKDIDAIHGFFTPAELRDLKPIGGCLRGVQSFKESLALFRLTRHRLEGEDEGVAWELQPPEFTFSQFLGAPFLLLAGTMDFRARRAFRARRVLHLHADALDVLFKYHPNHAVNEWAVRNYVFTLAVHTKLKHFVALDHALYYAQECEMQAEMVEACGFSRTARGVIT